MTAMRRDVTFDRLAVACQPIVDLYDGAVLAAEAILPLRPAHVDRLLGQALAERAGWRHAAPTVPISVDVPFGALFDRRLPDRVRRALSEAGLPAQALMVELAEPGALPMANALLEDLRELREMGVRIAVDDFGSGPMSLACLSRVPATDLKIAPDLVATMLSVPYANAVVAAAAAVAGCLGLRVIAVGAHTPEHVRAARAAGAHAAQVDAADWPLHPSWTIECG
jgi:EAL domain-containing protein (putative c-di-GMP-specific phosphodiesterase class I)